MSEIDADLDRAAAAYWLSVASKSTPEKNVALAGRRTCCAMRGRKRVSRTARASQRSMIWKHRPWTCRTGGG